ncbi:MAG: nucleotidyltransferase [Nitrospirae bacterium]|nr:nucleotidyltransferase [Nitrospirota bacterium]
MPDNPLVQYLKELCLFLDNSGIEYMLVGGLAVGIWGEPRATVDIDFLISFNLDDFAVLRQKKDKSNAFVFIHDKPMTFDRVSLLRTTLKSNLDVFVDFLFADDDFQKEALSRRQAINIADFTVNIPTPEDLILLKLISGREQDLLDAKKVFIMQKAHLDMKYVQRWSEKLQVKLPLTG